MGRTTISLPDPLVERLDRLRDRLNVSKVCATALEKECDMLEARPAPADPDIERAIRRLQSTKERWHQRGRTDGKRWAVDVATRAELAGAAEPAALPPAPPEGLAGAPGVPPDGLPGSFDLEASLKQWLDSDAASAGTELTIRLGGQPVGVAREITPTDRAHAARARAELDRDAYLDGWRLAVREVWSAVKPLLE